MKKLLSFLFLIILSISPVYADDKDFVDENINSQTDVETCEKENVEEIEEELISAEEKVMDDDTIYFDVENYKKSQKEGKIFKLKVEENEDILKNNTTKESINFQTKYTDAQAGKSQFNNKSTIYLQALTNSELLGDSWSLGYNAELKEYMPIPDSTNYSMISTSLLSQYKFKNLTLEGEFAQNNNLVTEIITNQISLGPKYRINKSTSIKGTVSKNFGDDAIWNELSIVYKPNITKRDLYIEFNACTSNTQYNIPQRRLQIYGKIKI